MACGGLVAGSLRTGMAEMLTEDCGILVPPGDVSALVKALSGALALSSGERARMKGAAIQRARDDFDHGVIIPELLNVYEETLSSFKLRFR
jgi:glycosyltransferase involved in cell wall biosynthesis